HNRSIVSQGREEGMKVDLHPQLRITRVTMNGNHFPQAAARIQGRDPNAPNSFRPQTHDNQDKKEPMNSATDSESLFTSPVTNGTLVATDDVFTRRSALIIGHPGHELCVYGWSQLARPFVFILTDGSGRTGASRTGRSVRLLNRLGCTTVPGSGSFTDQEIYRALLDRNHNLLTMLTRQI